MLDENKVLELAKYIKFNNEVKDKLSKIEKIEEKHLTSCFLKVRWSSNQYDCSEIFIPEFLVDKCVKAIKKVLSDEVKRNIKEMNEVKK